MRRGLRDTMVARRTAKIFQLHQSLGLVVPIDWARGMGVEKGDQVEIEYNGELRIRPKTKRKGVPDGDRIVEPLTA